METPGWRTDPSVEDQLVAEGYRFDFFQAVRLLQNFSPHRELIGYDTKPSEESIRFHANPSLSFPPSSIYDIARNENREEPLQMTVNFFGLFGPMGVLPQHYTDLLMDRLRDKDRTLLDFLDIFNHRMLSLFYRAWEKYRVPFTYERLILRHHKAEDHMSQCLYAFLGLGTPGLKQQLTIDDRALLPYSGLLAQRPPSACALEQSLVDMFRIPVRLHQFIGEWLDIADEDRTRLGAPDGNNILGETTVAGSQVWDQQSKFDVDLGPLTLTVFLAFLPSGKLFEGLIQWIRFYVGIEFNFDIRPRLLAQEVPSCYLTSVKDTGQRLGWSSWLKTREFTHDASDVIFSSTYSGDNPSMRAA